MSDIKLERAGINLYRVSAITGEGELVIEAECTEYWQRLGSSFYISVGAAQSVYLAANRLGLGVEVTS